MRINYIWILLFLVQLPACVEEFRPEIDSFDSLLVVDGKITNEPGPYTIQLSTSANLDDKIYLPIENATVQIEEQNGSIETLTEVSKGRYETDPNGLQGQVGKSYKLIIKTPDGKDYASNYETIKAPTAINEINTAVDYQTFEDAEDPVPGYRFFLEGENTVYDQGYYLWLFEGTYKYEADLLITGVFNGIIEDFPSDLLRTCWRTYQVSTLATSNTSSLAEQKIPLKALFFLRADDKILSIRYSLLAKQYSINKSAYEFWNGIEQQVTDQASLYTSQPYQIRGNVNNLNDPSEAVLGYFFAAGVTEKRFFYDAPEDLNIELAVCRYDYRGYGWALQLPPSEWPIYITTGPEGNAVAGPGCLDCRELDGTIVRPDFWID